jgi:hypothetical protein
MIFYNVGDDDVLVGLIGLRHCPDCGQDCQFSLEAYYRYYSFNLVFNWVARIRPFLACSNCGARYKSDGGRDERREILREIPWWRRWGGALSLAAGAMLLIMAMLFGR